MSLLCCYVSTSTKQVSGSGRHGGSIFSDGGEGRSGELGRGGEGKAVRLRREVRSVCEWARKSKECLFRRRRRRRAVVATVRVRVHVRVASVQEGNNECGLGGQFFVFCTLFVF